MDVFNPGQQRLERFPAGDAAIDVIVLIRSHERQVGKCPPAGIEAVAVVNKGGVKLLLPMFLDEKNLAGIAVAHPFIEGQYSHQILTVCNPPENRFGKVLQDLIAVRTGGIAGRELQSAAAWDAAVAELDRERRSVSNEPTGDFHDAHLGHRDGGFIMHSPPVTLRIRRESCLTGVPIHEALLRLQDEV